MPKIARPLLAPPEDEVITPERPIPVMITMVHDGEEWDLPAVAEAWTASQLVRIRWTHPRTRQDYTNWIPSSAISCATGCPPPSGASCSDTPAEGDGRHAGPGMRILAVHPYGRALALTDGAGVVALYAAQVDEVRLIARWDPLEPGFRDSKFEPDVGRRMRSDLDQDGPAFIAPHEMVTGLGDGRLTAVGDHHSARYPIADNHRPRRSRRRQGVPKRRRNLRRTA